MGKIYGISLEGLTHAHLNCLCHGDVLRDEFRRIAADVFAAR